MRDCHCKSKIRLTSGPNLRTWRHHIIGWGSDLFIVGDSYTAAYSQGASTKHMCTSTNTEDTDQARAWVTVLPPKPKSVSNVTSHEPSHPCAHHTRLLCSACRQRSQRCTQESVPASCKWRYTQQQSSTDSRGTGHAAIDACRARMYSQSRKVMGSAHKPRQK
jgi:hypothetical protein